MAKRSITAQDVCDFLNEILELDPECAKALVTKRVKCNKAIADHPTIQVQQSSSLYPAKVGLIGVLNGIFGVRADGLGPICYEFNKNKIVGFKTTPIKKHL